MAEMPDFYADGEYDLAGTIVGIVNREEILDVSRYSRATSSSVCRRTASTPTVMPWRANFSSKPQDGPWTPTWVNSAAQSAMPCWPLTGVTYHRPSVLWKPCRYGGWPTSPAEDLSDNLPRTLPDGLGARVFRGTWPELPVFNLLQKVGDDIETDEMFRVFNMGLGLVLVVPSSQAEKAIEQLSQSGETGYVVGEVVNDPGSGVQIL